MTQLARPFVTGANVRAEVDRMLWRPADLPYIPDGCEWVTNRNPHVLGAELARLSGRGHVELINRWQVSPVEYGALVMRLKPRTPVWVRRAAITAAVVAVLVGAAGLVALVVKTVWDLVVAAGGAFVVAFLVWLLVSAVRGHACKGVHCGRCPG